MWELCGGQWGRCLAECEPAGDLSMLTSGPASPPHPTQKCTPVHQNPARRKVLREAGPRHGPCALWGPCRSGRRGPLGEQTQGETACCDTHRDLLTSNHRHMKTCASLCREDVLGKSMFEGRPGRCHPETKQGCWEGRSSPRGQGQFCVL